MPVGVGLSNVGIIAHFQSRLNSDAAFARSAKLFYDKLWQIDAKRRDQLNLGIGKPLGSRASLGEVVGQTSTLQNHDIFKLALAAANGREEDALAILTICGNDDVFTRYEIPSIKISKFEAEVNELESRLSVIVDSTDIHSNINPEQIKLFTDALATLAREQCQS